MLGAIIGDIIGSRFEFNNCIGKNFELFTNRNYFTDDTVCTVAIAEAILHNCSFTESLVKWCSEYDEPYRSYGGMFLSWLNSKNKTPYYSFGNGSAMRVSPAGWLYEIWNDTKQAAKNTALVTHNHPEGIKGAESVAYAIFLARKGYSTYEIITGVEDKFDYKIERLIYYQNNNEFNETCQGTIPQVLACIAESESFEDAIRNAISIGGDSDTIAAITGSIAEAIYGIPDEIIIKAISYIPDDMRKVIEEFYNKIKNYNGKRLQFIQVLQRQ